jgi:hypothetical protein
MHRWNLTIAHAQRLGDDLHGIQYGNPGHDQDSDCLCCLASQLGVKGGISCGASDEIDYNAAEN